MATHQPRGDVAGARTAPTRRYRPPDVPVDHRPHAAVAPRLLHAMLVEAFVASYRAAPALGAQASQVFRDAARDEGRSLGSVKIERGLRAIAAVDPREAREACHRMAVQFLAFADLVAPRPAGQRVDLVGAWTREEREECAADAEVVGVIHACDPMAIERAIARKRDDVAAGLDVLAVLHALRGPCPRPLGVAHYVGQRTAS